MQLAVTFPQNEVGRDLKGIRDFAQAAEGLGFVHLRRGDHVIGAAPEAPTREGHYSADFVYHEPLIFFSYVAGITTRIGFVTTVLLLPQRQTVLVAKQAAELDFLSGGRLRIGTGVGWQDMEYRALNENFSNRGARIVEQYAVLRALWTQETVNFDGKWHHIDNAGINPMPVQRPIPLYMGGRAENVLRRAARIADGWIAAWDEGEQQRAEVIQPVLDRVRGYVAEAGRDPAAFGFQGTMNLGRGSPDEWAQQVEAWKQTGATTVVVGTRGEIRQHYEQMRQLADATGLKDGVV